MYETHHGLSKEYEVSCEELDFLNDVAKENGVTGSRIMGGGFGGCTINLVKDELYDKFIADVTEKFTSQVLVMPQKSILWLSVKVLTRFAKSIMASNEVSFSSIFN